LAGIAAGIHTGECEAEGDRLAGMAVHVGARVMPEAGPGEILVTSIVKELTAGAGFGHGRWIFYISMPPYPDSVSRQNPCRCR
jgi:class 3 adenylate cyclase